MEQALLAGRYRLDTRLGGGGMGEVWRGVDQVLGRRVAVKLIHAELRDDAGVAGQALSRFRREATAAAQLNHRNITTVHDFGEHPDTDRDGRVRLFPFLVLEFLEGSDLDCLLAQAPVGLPIGQVLDYGIQTCAGLAEAHRAGVVHRDIKPANLMLLPDGTVKICDFGIAHLTHTTTSLTAYGVRMGTPGYMPPEQEQGRSVDLRADLYALGVTLHQLLTGSKGFGASPAGHQARVHTDFNEIIDALVAADPDQRPASADEVAERLRGISRCDSGDRQHVEVPAYPPAPGHIGHGLVPGTRREVPTSPKPHSSWPVPRQLPAPTSVLVGRQEALDGLDELLPDNGASETVVISAIAGGAGIGKTTLAVHWAHQIADRFPDGALFVNLRGYDPDEPLHPLQALDDFLRAMDVPASKIPAELHARSALFRSMLAGRRVLLVLDNAASPDQVRPLLPGSPGCLALVTSRSHLAGLTAREGAHRVSLDVLSPDQAVQLLRRTIGADRIDADPDHAYELARRCGHLPLALRIAADRAASQPHLQVADLVAELTDERHRLDVLAAADDPTTAVRTVFSWSYRQLSESAARAFRLLGLHAGPDITLEAAAVLLDLPVPKARPVLDTLTGQHLLQHSGRGRYRFHDLLGVYAAERADRDQSVDSCEQAIQRLLTWYLHTAYAARNLLIPLGRRVPLHALSSNGPPPVSFTSNSQALAWLEAHKANLVTAVREAIDFGHDTIAWKLAHALTPFLFLRWYPDDLHTVLSTGLAGAQHQGDSTGQALMLQAQGELLNELGRNQESIALEEKALSLSQQAGDRWTEGASHNNIGRYRIALSEFGTATEHLREALQIFRNIPDHRMEGIALLNLGAAHLGLGQLDSAIDCNQRAVAILEETRNPDSQALALRQLGETYRQQQRYAPAVHHYRKALAILRGTEFRTTIGNTLVELGGLYLTVDQVKSGRQCLQEALTILAPVDHPSVAEIRSLLAATETGPGTTTP